MDVILISHTPEPLRALYLAYRTCYSSKRPSEILEEYENAKKTPGGLERLRAFFTARFSEGHTSPLEQVVFEFIISGVSRAFSHQFVRHRVGISFEQQSQRYVRFKSGDIEYVTPPSIKKDPARLTVYMSVLERIAEGYEFLIQSGVPAEDARFLLPNAATTNLKVSVNLAEMLHIGDLRLCTRAQWEIRFVVAKMRAEIMRAVPELGVLIQPKCGERRKGYCDESLEAWRKCPLGAVRPHRTMLPA